MHTPRTSSALFVLVACALGACVGDLSPVASGRLEVAVSALNLGDVGDVVWDIEVKNGADPADTVWRQRVSASRFGDGVGSATWIGPCDASPGATDNVVSVWIVGIYGAPVTDPGAFAAGSDAGVGAVEGEPLAFSNPTGSGPLTRVITCVENADQRVDFDVTLMRPALQGFFDVAVTFDDIFCSAKLDCCADRDGTPGCAADGSEDQRLLFTADGERGATMVLAFACTAGPETDVATELYLDRLELDCTAPSAASFAADLRLDPSGAPGNQCVAGAMSACAGVVYEEDPTTVTADDHLFQMAVYRGAELLRSGLGDAHKVYWNIALGVERPAIGQCRLRTRATADDGNDPSPMQGGVVMPPNVYPYIQFDADLATCGEEALGDSTMVYATYTRTDGDALAFDHGYGQDLPAGPLAPADVRFVNQTAQPVDLEILLPEHRSASRFELAKNETLIVPLRPGLATVRAMTQSGAVANAITLLDQDLAVRGGTPMTLGITMPVTTWQPPTTTTYLIGGDAPAPGAFFTCSGADRERATLSETPTDDGVVVTLSCPVRGDASVFQTLQSVFVAPARATPVALSSGAYNRLVSLFDAFKSESALAHFEVDTSKGFKPFVATHPDRSSRSDHPGFIPDYLPWSPIDEGGELSFYTPPVTYGEFKTGARRDKQKTLYLAQTIEPLTLEYRTYDKIAESGQALFELQFSTTPTNLGKQPPDGSCDDIEPAEGEFRTVLVEAEMDRSDPLYDRATFPIELGPFAEETTFWIRVMRLRTINQGGFTIVECAQYPSNWVAVLARPFPSVAPCEDDCWVGPVGPASGPVPAANSAITYDVVAYKSPILESGPLDILLTQDRYIVDDPYSPQCEPYCPYYSNPFGWPEGCIFEPGPYLGYDSNAWYDDLFDYIVTAWESVAAFYNAAIDTVIYTVSLVIPGCKAECPSEEQYGCEPANFCGKFLKVAASVALTAAGIPPSAPSFQELMDEGMDYIIDYAAGELEAQTGIPASIAREGIELATQKLRANLKNIVLGQYVESDPWTWGIPWPDYNMRKASVQIRITRTTDPTKTFFPEVLIVDLNGTVFEQHLVPVPRLAPGQSTTAVLELEPRLHCPPSVGVCTPGDMQLRWRDEQYQNGAATVDLGGVLGAWPANFPYGTSEPTQWCY